MDCSRYKANTSRATPARLMNRTGKICGRNGGCLSPVSSGTVVRTSGKTAVTKSKNTIAAAIQRFITHWNREGASRAIPRGAVLVCCFAVLCTAGAFRASPLDLQTLEEELRSSARDFTDALPLNGTIGLSGGRPFEGREFRGRFVGPLVPAVSAGITVGATFFPFSYIQDLLDALEIEDGTDSLEETGLPGIPLPGYAIDLRVGAPLFPFEVGTSYSFVPDEAWQYVPENVTALDYRAFGVGLRRRTGRDAVNHPSRQAMGFAYSYLGGDVGVRSDDDIEIGEFEYLPTDSTQTVEVGLTDVSAAVEWESHTAEVHWSIGTRHGPFEGYSGVAIGGGLSRFQVRLDSDLTLTQDGVAVPDNLRETIITGVETLSPDVSLSPGIDADSNWRAGWYVRGFGGLSVLVWPVSLGVGLSYAIIPGVWTISATTRIRL